MKMQKRAVHCQPPCDAVRCSRMKSKCLNLNFPTSGHPFLTHRRPGDRRKLFRPPVLSDTSPARAILPLRRTRDCSSASVVVGPRHQRIATTRILSTLTTSFLRLPPRGKLMTTDPAARSPLPFFGGRPSYPLIPTQSPHHTDSAFYASAHPKRPSSCRKFAMRKGGVGACAFPRAGCPRTWSTCSKSSRNSLSSWVRRCRR